MPTWVRMASDGSEGVSPPVMVAPSGFKESLEAEEVACRTWAGHLKALSGEGTCARGVPTSARVGWSPYLFGRTSRQNAPCARTTRDRTTSRLPACPARRLARHTAAG